MSRFNILVLEDAVVTSVAISRALELEFPDCPIYRAQSLFEARLLLETYDIQFCIVDIQLPDGCGIDLIPDLVAKNPSAGVVIATASKLPRYRDSASAFGVLHFMEKPVDQRRLGDLVRQYRNAYLGDNSGSDTSFAAFLKRLSVADILQLKCLARTTVSLDFSLRDGRHGRVYIVDGEIAHAEVRAQALEGVAAFREIVSWRGGKVEESNSLAERHTIDRNWQELLLNTVHWLDEHAAAPADSNADEPPALR
jgi:DNA-binding NarL/FixJ family response regulator